jgi:hypothetical protein
VSKSSFIMLKERDLAEAKYTLMSENTGLEWELQDVNINLSLIKLEEASLQAIGTVETTRTVTITETVRSYKMWCIF